MVALGNIKLMISSVSVCECLGLFKFLILFLLLKSPLRS